MNYRGEDVAQNILGEMRRLETRSWVLMEVCGGACAAYYAYGRNLQTADALHQVASVAALGAMAHGD